MWKIFSLSNLDYENQLSSVSPKLENRDNTRREVNRKEEMYYIYKNKQKKMNKD